MVRAELFRLGGFRGAGGESGDLAAPRVEELEREMAKSADAHHSHAVSGLHAEIRDGREDRDATTEQRAGAGGIGGIWKLDRPFPVRPHLVGEASVTADDHSLCSGAKLLATG
jgi:hypothetical protein